MCDRKHDDHRSDEWAQHRSNHAHARKSCYIVCWIVNFIVERILVIIHIVFIQPSWCVIDAINNWIEPDLWFEEPAGAMKQTQKTNIDEKLRIGEYCIFNQLTLARRWKSNDSTVVTTPKLISRCHSHLVYGRSVESIKMICFSVKHSIGFVSWNHQRFPQIVVPSTSTEILVACGNLSKSKRVVDDGRERFGFPRDW